MIRLTFVGDIALDKPLLEAAKKRGNSGKDKYDFSDVFHTQEVFAKSDLVVGNLETCFGGGQRYNTKPYHYNSPDSFCRAIKDAGIGLVSTANNHCMDEGIGGLKRTNQLLDDCGILHTGTYAENTTDRFFVKEFEGFKVAFYSLTYSVNVCMESLACDDLYRNINLIGFSGKRIPLIKQYYRYVIKRKLNQIKRKKNKQSTISAHTDIFKQSMINEAWMSDIEKQLKRAKEQADLIVILLHIGGQFNTEPGDFSKHIVELLADLGADIIIGNHPHTVQKIDSKGKTLIAYSLGGYCMSPSAEYLVHDCLPEYSIALHVDIDESTGAFETSFDVLKGTEDHSAYLSVEKTKADDPGAEIIRSRCRN